FPKTGWLLKMMAAPGVAVVAAVAAAKLPDRKLHKGRDAKVRTKRQGIIVWFQHRKNIKQIKRYGNLLYVSKKMRYAVIYTGQDKMEEVVHSLLKLSFITKVDVSARPFIKTDYENAIPDEAKEYDYKIGI